MDAPTVADADADTPSATVARHVTWYEAASPHGTLKLALTGEGTSVRHAADAAIALHACEPLLAGFDGWSDEPVDWVWRGPAAPAGRPGADPAAARSWLVWRGGRAMVSCPLAWLRARPAPGAWADELELPAVAAVIVGGRMRVPAPALAELEVGGAIVVEPSFRSRWHGLLRAFGEDALDDLAGTVVALGGVDGASPSQPWYLPGADPAAALQPSGDPEDPLCELRLALPAPVAAEGLAGWRHGAVGPAGAASLWQCAAPRRPARRLAGGHLMPWGDGWALSIEAVGDAARG